MRHVIRIELSKEDEKFLRWLTRRDDWTISDELENMFYLEFEEQKQYFYEEYEAEEA